MIQTIPLNKLVLSPRNAAATAALVELRGTLDQSWRKGRDASERFDLFRLLGEEARAAWLGLVVARSFEASLNVTGERAIPFHDHLGGLIGIDIAAWWRPTAANFFDRVSKQVILAAIGEAGGPELAARFASAKKGDLAASAERIFAGSFITEAEVKERALGWVPAAMRFASVESVAAEPAEESGTDAMTSPQPDDDDPDYGEMGEASAPPVGNDPAQQAAQELAA